MAASNCDSCICNIGAQGLSCTRSRGFWLLALPCDIATRVKLGYPNKLLGCLQEEQAEAEKKKKVIEDAKARGAAKAKLTKSMIVLDVKPWDDTTGTVAPGGALHMCLLSFAVPAVVCINAVMSSGLKRVRPCDRPKGDGGRSAGDSQGGASLGRGCGLPCIM